MIGRPEWRWYWRRLHRTGRQVSCATCTRHGLAVQVRYEDGWHDYVLMETTSGDVVDCDPSLDALHARMADTCADMDRIDAEAR